MEKSNLNFILFIFILSITNCTNKDSIKISNDFYKKNKSNFVSNFDNLNLMNHFPSTLNNTKCYFETSGVSSSCTNHNGYFFLIDKNLDSKSSLDSLIKKSIYTVKYSNNNNTIIDLSNLKRDTIFVEKCNTYFPNTKPIPYFEGYNFNLGYKTIEKKIDNYEIYVDVYTLPEDLKVYVINAEAGDFWKKSCNLKRPKSLKEWQHGYSRGVAVSDKENLIVYWTMLW